MALLLVSVKIVSITLLLLNSGGLLTAGRVEEAEKEGDRVTELPGQPAVNFKHYAGYVKLNPPNGHKALFYWFFQAQHKPLQKPLVLWLNGGPGCSSIAYGAAQELGPFLVRGNGTLILNKFSWNKAANMLFVEAPVGVGFSYTNKSRDLNELGDRVTSEDSYDFLTQWFKRFPNFKSRDFYLSGESYAGHYVPQLADLIHKKNNGGSKETFINLKGFMIGNAVINDETDTSGLFDYAWSHAIISDQLYHGLVKECTSNNNKNNNETNLALIKCEIHVRDFFKAYSEIDMYSIYSPVCLHSVKSNPPKLAVAPRLFTQHEMWHRVPAGYDPCTEEYAENYFNRKDVQRALHANLTNLSYPYSPCSSIIRRWKDSPDTILPIIQRLLDAGLRIWVYSGDTDGRVPITSTRYSIKKMGLKVREEWRPWFHNAQVAGFVEVYQGGLTLATVRGAGHQVPVLAPDQSLALLSHFLSSGTLPASRF